MAVLEVSIISVVIVILGLYFFKKHFPTVFNSGVGFGGWGLKKVFGLGWGAAKSVFKKAARGYKDPREALIGLDNTEKAFLENEKRARVFGENIKIQEEKVIADLEKEIGVVKQDKQIIDALIAETKTSGQTPEYREKLRRLEVDFSGAIQHYTQKIVALNEESAVLQEEGKIYALEETKIDGYRGNVYVMRGESYKKGIPFSDEILIPLDEAFRMASERIKVVKEVGEKNKKAIETCEEIIVIYRKGLGVLKSAAPDLVVAGQLNINVGKAVVAFAVIEGEKKKMMGDIVSMGMILSSLMKKVRSEGVKIFQGMNYNSQASA